MPESLTCPRCRATVTLGPGQPARCDRCGQALPGAPVGIATRPLGPVPAGAVGPVLDVLPVNPPVRQQMPALAIVLIVGGLFAAGFMFFACLGLAALLFWNRGGQAAPVAAATTRVGQFPALPPIVPAPPDVLPVPPPNPPEREPERGVTRADYEQPDPAAAPFAVDPRLKDATGKVFLSDLQEFGWKPGPSMWKFGKNGDVGNGWNPTARISVNGTSYPKGLGMHPPDKGYTRICYALGQKGQTLTGAVGIAEDEAGRPQPTRFVVLGDGKLLWRSDSIRAKGVAPTFSIDVGAVQVLELRVYVENGYCGGSHAAWLDPVVAVR